MAVVTMKSLLESGVHFGHQTRRWNPKMKPYIFTQRGGIYILNLQKTMREMERAYKYTFTVGQRGGEVLFVGTKKQAQEPLERAAKQAGMPYVTHRWLGGMLTNFETVRSRVKHMEAIEKMIEDGTMATLPKKEQILRGKELTKLRNNLEGIRNMRALPAALFVVDTLRETIAIAEARRLKIPIIALVDTNSDPDEIDFPIPANDDAIRAISLITNVISSAILEGNGGITAPQPTDAEVAAEELAARPVVPANAIPTAAPAIGAEAEIPEVAVVPEAIEETPEPIVPELQNPEAQESPIRFEDDLAEAVDEIIETEVETAAEELE